MQTEQLPDLIGGRQAAGILGCSEAGFYKLVGQGQVEPIPYGKIRKYRRSDVESLRDARADLMGIGEAAAALGVSEDLLRDRVGDGSIRALRTPGGHLRFARSDVTEWREAQSVQHRPPGVQRVAADRELRELSQDEQAECMRIAEAVAHSACRKWKALDYDEALSDALYGVAIGLRRDTDVPWNVSCYNHARWQVLKGIRKASGISSREYDQGVRYEALPAERRIALSLEDLLTHDSISDLIDNADRAVNRLHLQLYLNALPRQQRIVLTNTCGHGFTDEEVSAGLHITTPDVSFLRQQALATISRWMRREDMQEVFDHHWGQDEIVDEGDDLTAPVPYASSA